MKEKTVKTTIYIAKDGTEFKNKEQCEMYDKCLTNLYKSTIYALKSKNKNFEDVKYVKYCGEYYTTIEQFLEVAKNIYYDGGYGGVEINQTILIVGFNWWLERNEYDGSEWWEYKEIPSRDCCTLKDITKSEIL